MISYSKCLETADYSLFIEHQIFDALSADSKFRYEHKHRKWEYGLACKFVGEVSSTNDSVLNVGGGNSPLSTVLVDAGLDVSEIDASSNRIGSVDRVKYYFCNFPSPDTLRRYDHVISTSVIEHVQDDIGFFISLLSHANKSVFITTDFHSSGLQLSQAHLRTYNSDSMERLLEIGIKHGFTAVGGHDYNWTGDKLVYDYTFASLGLVRK